MNTTEELLAEIDKLKSDLAALKNVVDFEKQCEADTVKLQEKLDRYAIEHPSICYQCGNEAANPKRWESEIERLKWERNKAGLDVRRELLPKLTAMGEKNDRLVKVVLAAADLHDFLHSNAGTTDDWPIDLVARGEDPAIQLCDKLTRLKDALAAVKEK